MKLLNKFDTNHMVRQIPSGPVLYACLLAILATTFLITTYYVYIPLRVDGGWYGYPALSLSKGRDPGENYTRFNDLKENPGVKAIFAVGDDFRRSLRIIPMTLWFMAFGATIWVAKLFGILEYLILLFIMYLSLRKICRDCNVLLLCFTIYLLDHPVIWWSSNNLRPDIFIAAVTLCVFLLAQMDETTKHRMVIFLAGIVLMFFLPLIRISAAIPLVFLSSYLFIELYLSWQDLPGFKKWFYISLIAAGIIGYVLRDHLLDMIISTKYPYQLPYHMDQYSLAALKQRTLTHTLLKELHRWREYFPLSNIGTLLAILLGLCLLIGRSLFRKGETPKRKVIRIGLSCLAAMVFLAIFGPTRSSGHSMFLVAFFILIVARELELVPFPRTKKLVIPLLLLIVFVSVGMRFAQGINVVAKSIKNEYSNAAVVEAIDAVFDSSRKNYVVFGSTELWPYFNPKKNVLIVDFRHKWTINRLSDALKSVDYIIIDKSYDDENWEKKFLSRYPGIELKSVHEVGNPMSGWYFIRVTRPSFSG